MEAMKKQASKLREQVTKHQQAVLRQLSNLGNEMETIGEAELQCHEQLQLLYNSTGAGKHFQRDIVRGIGGFISSSEKQMEIERKMAEDSCKYGTENQSTGSILAKAALLFGTSRKTMENERETMLMIFASQVSEPLRAIITGAPLEDARHLTHWYERLCQEVESQAVEVTRHRSKFKDPTLVEASTKLQGAEKKLNELRSAMMAIQREAIDSMLYVEDQQQRVTFQKLLIMVDAEKSYHQNVLATLDKLHAEVIHSFDAQEEGELSLFDGDYVLVRHVGLTGWSEGECRGRAGWFPSAYVKRKLLHETF